MKKSFALRLFLNRLKKKIPSILMIVGVLTAAIIIFIVATDFQSADSYYNQAGADKPNSIGKVSITIRCDTIPDKSAKHIPDDGIILDICELEIESGDTVYDILSEATAKNKIHLETSGSGDSIYVQGINNIYGLDFGDLSGWMFFVNGESKSVGCKEYILSAGDEIEWLYTCNMGEDLKKHIP